MLFPERLFCLDQVDGRRGQLQLADAVPVPVPPCRRVHGAEAQGALLVAGRDGAAHARSSRRSDLGQ